MLKKFIHNYVYIILSLIPCSIVIGFLPHNPLPYYLMLIVLLIYAVLKASKISILPIWLLLVCVISILWNSPPNFFRSWERLALFSILLCAVFPIFESKKLYEIRRNLFECILIICSLIGVSSVFCYLLGINYMTRYYGINDVLINTAGVFSGITTHSMVLGICSAIGVVYLTYKSTKPHISIRNRYIYIAITFMSFCGVLLSSSRISFGAAFTGFLVILYLRYKAHFSKLIGIFISCCIILLAAYPIYNQFAEPLINKQKNNIESGGMFASREERWSHRINEFTNSPFVGIGFAAISPEYTDEYNIELGIVEPGSSWLTVLSMIGIMGALPIILIIINTWNGLKAIYNNKTEDYSILLSGLLSLFYVHLIAEGYIFAGGSFLCFLFWLTLGISYSYPRIYKYQI